MMAVAAVVMCFALNKFRPMTDSEFKWGLGIGALLMVLGYLAPSIKRFVVSKSGVLVETHDRSDENERREEAVSTSAELESGQPTVTPSEAVWKARFYAASLAMEAILEPAFFDGAVLHVYLMDEDAGGLVPAFEASPRVVAQRPWRPGVGVVGKAFLLGEFIVAIGAEASDGTHGLDDEQQAEHESLAAVAATPILNAEGSVLGVLAASEREKDPEECLLATEVGRLRVEAAAEACARVLVDLLGIFSDDV